MKCEDCRYWSEMIAEAMGGGPIKALCLSPESPLKMQMTTGNNGCQDGKENLYGAVDAPGNSNAYNQEVS